MFAELKASAPVNHFRRTDSARNGKWLNHSWMSWYELGLRHGSNLGIHESARGVFRSQGRPTTDGIRLLQQSAGMGMIGRPLFGLFLENGNRFICLKNLNQGS